MGTYNSFNMASGEELGRYFARTLADALDAMARTAGFADTRRPAARCRQCLVS